MRPVCLPWSPLRLVVAEGGEDITIKVSDEGGGIARSGLPNIWTYLYSTAKSPVEMSQVGQGRVRGQAVPWVGVGGTGGSGQGVRASRAMGGGGGYRWVRAGCGGMPCHGWG